MLTLLTYNVLNRDAHYIEELLGCGVALCNQSDWRQGWNTSMDAKEGWAGGITQASSENQHYLGSMLQFNIIYPAADMYIYFFLHISSHTLPRYMICLYSSSDSATFREGLAWWLQVAVSQGSPSSRYALQPNLLKTQRWLRIDNLEQLNSVRKCTPVFWWKMANTMLTPCFLIFKENRLNTSTNLTRQIA